MRIKLFAMDVDGTMTDGKIYMGCGGELVKAFHVKDGQGIALLRKAGIVTAVITARTSEIVRNRAGELQIDEVWQGVSDKEEILRLLCEKYKLEADKTAYIGDDIGDLPALKFAGISFCPADAVSEVRCAAQVVLPSKGGEGAIRDAAEWILVNAANVSEESCNEA